MYPYVTPMNPAQDFLENETVAALLKDELDEPINTG